MAQRIVILNGSPRAKGNTVMLCDAFTRGAESAGNTVTRFNVHTMHIKGCIGCMQGGKNPASPCVQKDDMERIYPVFSEANIVVLATPMYYWTMTGQLKIVLDRLYAVAEARGGYKNPAMGCILLMVAGDDTAENWKPAVDYHNTMLEYLEWKDYGRVLAGGLLAAGDIAGHASLEEAYALGASIV